jgi:hypothetical protein
MIVITSGALIGPEMQAELGGLPPAMLPLGNRRLYEHQVQALRSAFSDDDLYLSLPESYCLPVADQLLLASLGVSVVLVPVELSLGESLLYVINAIGRYDEILRILHGDTLLQQFPLGPDFSAPRDDTARASCRNEAKSDFLSLEAYPPTLPLAVHDLLLCGSILSLFGSCASHPHRVRTRERRHAACEL